MPLLESAAHSKEGQLTVGASSSEVTPVAAKDEQVRLPLTGRCTGTPPNEVGGDGGVHNGGALGGPRRRGLLHKMGPGPKFKRGGVWGLTVRAMRRRCRGRGR